MSFITETKAAEQPQPATPSAINYDALMLASFALLASATAGKKQLRKLRRKLLWQSLKRALLAPRKKNNALYFLLGLVGVALLVLLIAVSWKLLLGIAVFLILILGFGYM